MLGDPIADAKRMFKHACAFVGCAQFCEREPWNIEKRLPDYTVADIVNSAFACEVFIKALLLYSGKTIEEIKKEKHRIEGLWKLLKTANPTLSNDIESRVINSFQSKDPDFFSTAMSTISEAFVTWRYIYELHGATIHINFLRTFREVIREVCCETLYHMTWNKYTKGAEQCQS